jgi:hypothetical protein
MKPLLRLSKNRRDMRGLLLAIPFFALALAPARLLATDYQVTELYPGQTVDIYFEINLTGTVSLRIQTMTGGFIEVHHLEPVSSIIGKAGAKLSTSINDVRPLCANCHRMAHRREPPFSIAELRAMIA